MPTTLSVITTSFPAEERGRGRSASGSGSPAAGPCSACSARGLLLEFFSWSSFFGLNVTLATLALVGTLAVVPASRDDDPPRLDLVGALLSLVAVGGIVFGIIEGPERGWSDPADR